MPPRHAYWTILIGNAPTAFRAHDRADLVPTFERLKQKQPEVTMKYFARGRLWESPEEARRQPERPDPSRARGRDWRPGGTHRDPRDRFQPKKGRPRFEGDWRDRLPDDRPSTEPRPPGGHRSRAQSANSGAWIPKKRHQRPSPGNRPLRTGDTNPKGDRKTFGDRKPFGGPRPYSAHKPFGAPKAATDLKLSPKRPLEPAPPERSRDPRSQSRRRDGRKPVRKGRR